MSCVLIVDDEPEYLDELLEALGFEGMSAVAVPSAAAALEALARDPQITIVLTDMRMPDMDGIAMIHSLRKAFAARRLDFLVMTGHAAETDMARAMAAGVRRCFPKPLAFDDLRDTLIALQDGQDAPG
ncbi:response regulator [Xanthobacter sp. AM11]|uniref:response regulator n=1 Tax=Xanthobacter sp. AM11 TaxID=3380643 RepID=UPI0039BF082B